MKIALIGNPNSGKTTLFNLLTGSRAKVGNWAGVTVEKKEGFFYYNEEKIDIVDLPGIYSLSAFSEEEVVARDYLFSDDFDVILNILDVTNLERNLYLTTQLMELGVPIVLAVNMLDSLEASGGSLDVETLEKKIDLPTVFISASKGIGIDDLTKKVYDAYLNKENFSQRTVLEFSELKDIIYTLENMLAEEGVNKPLFNAIKYLDNDAKTVKEVDKLGDEYKNIVAEQNKQFDIIIADNRYKYIETLLNGIYVHTNDVSKETMSDKIDKIITHKYLGIPLFFGVMLLVFTLTFSSIGAYMQGKMVEFIDVFVPNNVTILLDNLNVNDITRSLILDGIIPGVGMILTFLPQIILLFLFLTLLEDIGYMSRATFLMDNSLRKIGLSGKAFVPMIMGFGCSVPAIMATRTLENKRDRRMAIILTPFMSCGARLSVYVVFVNVFFESHKNLVIFSLYVIGIIVAIISGLILKNTVLKGEESSYIMELAPFRMPVAKNVALSLWDKVKGFVERASTLLLASSIVIWFLQSFDSSFHVVADNSYSIFADIGRFIAPIFIPLGFGTWEASVSLLTGLIAKEAVVSSLSIIYATENPGLSLYSAISTHFTPLSALSYMIFILLYTPCVVAIATTRKEMMSTKWTIFAICYQTITAYVIALFVYQVGSLLF